MLDTVQPHGYDSEGLQLALSYARFLEARKRRPESLQLLTLPLLLMDMDKNPNNSAHVQVLSAKDPRAQPRNALIYDRAFPRSRKTRVTRKEYIRVAVAEFERVAQVFKHTRGHMQRRTHAHTHTHTHMHTHTQIHIHTHTRTHTHTHTRTRTHKHIRPHAFTFLSLCAA